MPSSRTRRPSSSARAFEPDDDRPLPVEAPSFLRAFGAAAPARDDDADDAAEDADEEE